MEYCFFYHKTYDMYKLLLLFFIGMNQLLFSQDNFKDQFTVFTAESKALGKIEYCTFNSSINKRKPLLIFIHGSGNFPTFHYRNDLKQYAWSAFSILQKYKDDYHVLFVNKPGIPLFDTIQIDPKTGHFDYPQNDEFDRHYSLDWRALAASMIIDRAVKDLLVDRTKIVVMGHSQGGQVAPKIAKLNQKVTHVVMLNCNVLNHLYDFILQERLASFKGEQSFETTQSNIDSLYADYQKIFDNPTSFKDSWNNETYLRWASFSTETPLENMLKLKVPILLVAGGRDIWNSFVMNSDYAKIEFMSRGKNNLTYKVFPNANHFLQNESLDQGKTTTTDIKPQVFDYIMSWISSSK